tara:strand:+ start:5986 stop:7020 length:1035 start_codon:yes stop_codon:yes gene_type:complete
MINIGFFPAHPSQLWMMYSMARYAPANVNIIWYIRDKDITIKLADELKIDYKLVSEAGTGFLRNAWELFLNILKFLRYTKNDKVDIWFSKYGSVNIAAWILGKTNFSFNDDDADIVPFIALTSYPFSKKVFCTNWTRMGKYEKYAIRYPSFHELFYLHPNHFNPNIQEAFDFLKLKNSQPYILIRLSSLQAHHDLTAKGVSDDLLKKIITLSKQKYKIFISSEKPLKSDFEEYKINIPTSEIHTILAGASFVIGDSLTMITEAAMLGIPNFRISSFTGKIGTLIEIERRLLTQSARPYEEEKILKIVDQLITNNNDQINKNKELLLTETIDPIPFIWNKIMNSR